LPCQAAQTVLDRGHDIAAGAAQFDADIVHGIAEFSGEDDVLAPVAEHLAHLGFRAAAFAVGVRSIE